MTKTQFLDAVRQRLAGLPENDIRKSLDFYAEMIDDRVDDGLSEAEAVAAMGTPEYVASQILMDTPLPKLVKARKGGQAMKPWHIALIILCSPIWLTLLLGVLCVIFGAAITVAALIFALVISVVALLIAGIACAATGLAGLIGTGLSAAMLGLTAAGLILTGISILLALAFWYGSKSLVRLCRWLPRKVKSLFIRKEKTYE